MTSTSCERFVSRSKHIYANSAVKRNRIVVGTGIYALAFAGMIAGAFTTRQIRQQSWYALVGILLGMVFVAILPTACVLYLFSIHLVAELASRYSKDLVEDVRGGLGAKS